MITVENLSLALIQTDLYWENIPANLAMFEEKLWAMDQKVDIIVLPEMFTTGFTMNSAGQAEPMNLHSTKWILQMAGQLQSVITGSVIIKEQGNYFNRLLWASPEGELLYYDKRHLFRMAGEDNFYAMGKENKTFTCKGWKIRPQICYDLRFPVWSRNASTTYGEMEFDLLFYIASWPAARVSAWDALLRARAIENLGYCVGVNRIGKDGNGVAYCGHSAAYGFKGDALLECGASEVISIVELKAKELFDYRAKFPAWKDADPFTLNRF
jgi:predicted amidohydrolase